LTLAGAAALTRAGPKPEVRAPGVKPTGEAAARTTQHGQERLAGPEATRGGVLSKSERAAVEQQGARMVQRDGANVYVSRTEPGRYNVVVTNQEGKLITTFKNLPQQKLDGLAKRYGWGEPPQSR
jgi:hypothetical protein